MIEIILTTLSTLSDVKTALELTSKISRHILRKATAGNPRELQHGTIRYGGKQQALAATLREWEHIAAFLEPSIEKEMQQLAPKTLAERADLLAALASRYAKGEHSTQEPKLEHINLHHTAFVTNDEGKLWLKLGFSEQTKYLSGEVIDVPQGGKMPLPVFNVTMLGDSGVGKTVFMSTMYAKMRHGHRGIAIRAISNDIDLELEQNVQQIFGSGDWPLGTVDFKKPYLFELLKSGKPVAHIDWVDYRGGALFAAENSDEGKALINRLRNSHSIIWMIDMSRLKDKPIRGFAAALVTKVGRMAQLCRQAVAGQNNLRSILFVRTKADEVIGGNGVPHWEQACEQLLAHIGDDNFVDIQCSAAIPVSAVGRVTNDNKVRGDDPYNVEWPLILALAFMLETELRKLSRAKSDAQNTLDTVKPGQIKEFFRETFGLPPSESELLAMQELESISRQLIGMREVVADLIKDCPSSIKMFPKR